MLGSSSISDFLSSVALRGRSIVGLSRGTPGPATSAEVVDLCQKLLSSRGEASGIALSNEILTRYGALDNDGRLAFFEQLYCDFSADHEAVRAAVEQYVREPSLEEMAKLNAATEPLRRKLIIRLNLAPKATIRLIRMRADLLDIAVEKPHLLEVDRDFRKLFASWFNGGFLQLRRLDWTSPASILDNIMRYEAVHGMSGWQDLRARLDPPDRQIYGFFHPRLGDEPLIFIEVALMKDMPTNIQDILSGDRERLNADDATTAVFYSISNCQKGLRGIPLGSFLIKRVVEDLQGAHPHLRKFATLSPVPGFADWVKALIGDRETDGAAADQNALPHRLGEVQKLEWIGDDHRATELSDFVTAAAAYYVVREKDQKAQPADPVARFHLGNGARLERINWPADTSSAGLASSFGVMVNYLYDPEDLEKNHESFASSGTVAVSNQVRRSVPAERILATAAQATEPADA